MKFLACGALTGALIICAAAPSPALAAGDTHLLVGRASGTSAADRARLRDRAGVDVVRHMRLRDAEVVSVPAAEADDALSALRRDPDVRWAQRDDRLAATATMTDPRFSRQWSLHNTGQTIVSTTGLADADMDVPEAWASASGAGVTVGVVDTGADFTHEDMAGQYAYNVRETGAGRESNGVDDDGNGLVDDWRGWDFAYDDNDPADGDGHGTHVSGIIAAVNGNGVGTSGVAPDAKVMVIKALDDNADGSVSDVADALDYAGDMGLKVVNVSLGVLAAAPALTEAMASHPGTMYVVAAGNDGVNLDVATYFPCEAPAPNVVCVGASNASDLRASFSNYGASAVDLFAPGTLVLAPTQNSYYYMDGTSMATPNVAALAALLLERESDAGVAQLRAALVAGVDHRAALATSASGGRANAVGALAALTPARDNDGDDDGRDDAADNCPQIANVDQADRDADGAGDACDATTDGPDGDGDGVADRMDRCPALPGAASFSGCPASSPVDVVQAPALPAASPLAPAPRVRPRVIAASVKLVRLSRGARVKLTIRSSQTGTATVKLQRRAGSSFRTVSTRRSAIGVKSKVLTLGRLPSGVYRAQVTVRAGGQASAARTVSFRVR